MPPLDGGDPEAAARQYAELQQELRRIDVQLQTWWSAASGFSLMGPARRRYRLQHQNRDDETCVCVLCSDWRFRRDEVERVVGFVKDGHRWINCTCPTCTVVRALQMGLMAVANKRDLWIEMSYHAYTDKVYSRRANEVMTVIAREIENPSYRRGWWSHDGGCVAMDFWFRKVDKALGISRAL
jgi:hypothetical protein